jgi:hypothetical protein
VTLLDFDTVQLDMARALANAKTDPEDAVTAACSLVESVCRSILIELSLPLPPKRDIDSLVRAVQEPLALSPDCSDLPALIEVDVRQILSGLTSVAKGIGALRTHGGDAHGRERGYRRIDPRIAPAGDQRRKHARAVPHRDMGAPTKTSIATARRCARSE